jgi:hypothetical protein
VLYHCHRSNNQCASQLLVASCGAISFTSYPNELSSRAQ